MNYIYDVLANFNDCFYDFYDWNDSDNIIHIKKLPILKVSIDFFNKIKYCDVLVGSCLLEKIYRKTESDSRSRRVCSSGMGRKN